MKSKFYSNQYSGFEIVSIYSCEYLIKGKGMQKLTVKQLIEKLSALPRG
jgi:hypothetical protein